MLSSALHYLTLSKFKSLFQTVYSPLHSVFNATKSVSDRIYGAFTTFDSDAATVVTDNSANIHVWNTKKDFDFLRPLKAADHGVTTIGSSKDHPEGIGNVTIRITDDNGLKHKVVMKDTLYFPNSSVKILSCTKLAECFPNKDGTPDTEGTFITTKYNYSILTWGHGKYTKTFTHPSHNIPEIVVNEGNKGYTDYARDLDNLQTPTLDIKNSAAFWANNRMAPIVDKKFKKGERLILQENQVRIPVTFEGCSVEGNKLWFEANKKDGSTVKTFKQHLSRPEDPNIGSIPITPANYKKALENLPPERLQEIANPPPLDPLAQLWLSYHSGILKHSPKGLMIKLAKMGVIPKELLYYEHRKAPVCVSCQFGMGHKSSSKVKGSGYKPIRKPDHDKPGKCVSTDQLISAQPGLVPQAGGSLTRDRIWAANIAVDHYSNVHKAVLMRSPSTDETLAAKLATEKFFRQHGVKISQWHADNGRYADEEFIKEVDNLEQKITFCGVGAHNQNGIAEAGVKKHTLKTRTLLLHAKRYWPAAITTMLWPFALLASVEFHNLWEIGENGQTPMMKLLNLWEFPDMKMEHTFGCPVYILDSKLQSSSIGPPKWDPRTRLGIYVGRSPYHAGSVALVLNPRTGHVSPQYHLVFDDDFSTVPFMHSNDVPDHWEALVKSSTELATDEDFSLVETWYEQSMN